jgi:hypothetical protein
MIVLSLAAAVKTGRAMELPSPVASLVPDLVLNAVVTSGAGYCGLRRSRLREYPVCAIRAVVLRHRRMNGEEEGHQAKAGK